MRTAHNRTGAAGGKRFCLGIVLVILAGILLYLPSLGYAFVWDDKDLILENIWLTSASPVSDVLLHSIHYNAYWRPLTVLSFYLSYRISHAPMLFHAVQLGLHAIVILLVILWANMISANRRTALLAGLLFALHPMVSETVCFISARCNILATIGLLGALIGAHLVLKNRFRRGLAVYAASAFVGIWSKESGVLTVAVPVLYWLYGSFLSGSVRKAKRLAGPYAVLMLTGVLLEAAYVFARFFVIENIDTNPLLHSSGNLITTVMFRLSFWFGQMLLPVFSNPDYRWFDNNIGAYEMVLSAAGVVFVIAGAIYLWRKKQWTWLLCLLLLLMTASPFLGFVSTAGRAFSESWMYMALPFYAVPLAALFSWGLSRETGRRITLTVLVLLLMGYGALSIHHAAKWATQSSVIQGALDANPFNPKALHNRAQELHEQGRDEDAKKVLWSVVARTPRFAQAYEFLGFLYIWGNDFDKAEKVVRMGLENAALKDRLYGVLATIMLQTGRPADALDILDQAPDDLRFKEKPRLKAAALLQMGKTAEAMEILRQYVEQYPSDIPAAELYRKLHGQKSTGKR